MRLQVLGLASYPLEAAGTRYRLMQFVEPLAARGIDLTVRPFIDSAIFKRLYDRAQFGRNAVSLAAATVRRALLAHEIKNYDVVFIQREAMLLAPPLIEWWAAQRLRRPLVLDLDDATYLPQASPVYGRLSRILKPSNKTDKLIEWAHSVVCGNPIIARYVEARGKASTIIPTVVDTDVFQPVTPSSIVAKPEITIGWIGTHTTFPFLEKLFPVLQNLARDKQFILKIVGAGCREIKLQGVKIDNSAWELEREVRDFQTLDIGLYPLLASASTSDFVLAKSGFKAIQYMSVGVPFVVSPLGVCAEIGVAGVTHLTARTAEEWFTSLATLIDNHKLRHEMGRRGRQHALEHYTVNQQADKLAKVLTAAFETSA